MMLEYLLISLISLIIGVFIGFFVIKQHYLEKKIAYFQAYSEELEARLAEWKGKYYGIKGAEVRQEKAERVNQALAEAILMYKEGKDVNSIMKEIGTKYPDVAMDLLKKQAKIKI